METLKRVTSGTLNHTKKQWIIVLFEFKKIIQDSIVQIWLDNHEERIEHKERLKTTYIRIIRLT